MNKSPDVILIYPPHASVTQPYLSLPSLTAYLRRAGFRVFQYDASAEAFDLLLHPSNIAECLDKITHSLSKNVNQRRGRKERLKLALAEACGDFVLEHIEEAKSFFRRMDTFHDVAAYSRARNTFKRAMDIVSAAYHPLDMKVNELSFHRSTSWQNIRRFTMDESINPFFKIIRDIIMPKILNDAPVYGISVTYRTQLVPAFTFAQWIKRSQPDAKIVFGGAYLTSERRGVVGHKSAFRNVDAYVFGEGETPLLKLVELAVAGKPFPSEMPSVHLPRGRKRIENFGLLLLNSEDFDSLPTPDYEGLDLSKYFSPKPIFFLSSARGCYWRKCAFCSVSCTTGKTFRQRSIDNLKADIDTVVDRYGAQQIFFSDDCIPPKRLREIACHCRSKQPLYWQTEVRYEREFTPSLLQYVFDGGCRQLTFGNESGNQRVLDIMRKGTAVEENERIIKDANRAGIAVHLQNFIGFPSETKEEATQTVDQLVRLQCHVTSFAFGQFSLRENSLCGREPEKFGIFNVRVEHSRDIDTRLLYDVKRGVSQQETKTIFRRLQARLMRAFPHNNFFFDGLFGAHVMLYLERQKKNGERVFPIRSPDLNVSELIAAHVRLNGNDLTELPGPERNLVILFHNRTGECIPITATHLKFIHALDGTCSVLEAAVKTTLSEGEFDGTRAAAYAVVVYDMLTKEVLMRC